MTLEIFNLIIIALSSREDKKSLLASNKNILNVENNFNGKILIVNLRNNNFRKVKFSKKKNCVCAK